MRAKVEHSPPSRGVSALAGPEWACARQCAVLPILWMGPGLAAGIRGPSRKARAAVRKQVCPPARMHMPMPAARRLRCSLSLPHSSGRHLRVIQSHGDILGGLGAARYADADGSCMRLCGVRVAAHLCTDCDPTLSVSHCSPHVRRVDAYTELRSTLDPDLDPGSFEHLESEFFRVVWSLLRDYDV